ncbi:MAG: hypothetical protein LBV38_01210 [Alistipes sp.]|jgi:hypothetical protein|nr:hypothetical protein [Alistipes sp.]
MIKSVTSALSVLCLVFSLSGCGSEPVEEPVIPLELDKYVVTLYPNRPVNTIRITSGNGGYYIVYPERVNIGSGKSDGRSMERDYKDDMFKVEIDGHTITLECNPSVYDENEGHLFCIFEVKDQRGASRTFEVRYPYILCCLSRHKTEFIPPTANDFNLW